MGWPDLILDGHWLFINWCLSHSCVRDSLKRPIMFRLSNWQLALLAGSNYPNRVRCNVPYPSSLPASSYPILSWHVIFVGVRSLSSSYGLIVFRSLTTTAIYNDLSLNIKYVINRTAPNTTFSHHVYFKFIFKINSFCHFFNFFPILSPFYLLFYFHSYIRSIW